MSEIDFKFNPTGHRYTVRHKVGDKWSLPKPVVGVTTVTGIIAKEALIHWSAKLSAYYMRDNYKNGMSLFALAEEARVQHTSEKKKSAGVGTVGHKLIETLLLGKEVTMPIKEELKVSVANILAQHEAFEEDFTPETLWVEKPLYSTEHNFAGTADRLCKINGKYTLVDYKTQNRSYFNPDGIYGSNFAQLGGQWLLAEENGFEVEDAWIVNFAKDSKEYKKRSLSEIGLSKTDIQLYFLNCLGLYNINREFEWKVVK